MIPADQDLFTGRLENLIQSIFYKQIYKRLYKFMVYKH